jgi:hypothetical protein
MLLFKDSVRSSCNLMKPFASRLQRGVSFIKTNVISACSAYISELHYFMQASAVRAWHDDDPLHHFLSVSVATHECLPTASQVTFARLWNVEFNPLLYKVQFLTPWKRHRVSITSSRVNIYRRFRRTYCLHPPYSHSRGNPKPPSGWVTWGKENTWENLGVDGTITLKWIFRKWTGFIWLRTGTGGAGYCECCYEPSGSIK